MKLWSLGEHPCNPKDHSPFSKTAELNCLLVFRNVSWAGVNCTALSKSEQRYELGEIVLKGAQSP
jgi:hypothetical protein